VVVIVRRAAAGTARHSRHQNDAAQRHYPMRSFRQAVVSLQPHALPLKGRALCSRNPNTKLVAIAQIEGVRCLNCLCNPNSEEHMSISPLRSIKILVSTSIAAGALASASLPAQAGDGGAVAAGILGGTALGFAAGAAAASAPPPPYYYGPAYYGPAYAPPPRCWWEPREVWNGYAYVVRQVRYCQ